MVLLIFSAQAQGLVISDRLRDQLVIGDLAGSFLALAALVALRRWPSGAWWLSLALVVATLLDVANAAVSGLGEGLFAHVTGVPWLILAFYVPLLTVSALLLGWQLSAAEGSPGRHRAGSRPSPSHPR